MPVTTGKVLLLCYGQGGHRAQAHRLHRTLKEAGELPRVVSLTDEKGIGVDESREIVFRPLNRKGTSKLVAVMQSFVGLFANCIRAVSVLRICLRAESVLLVSLGPAFALTPAIVVRAAGGKVVHIETWSRFTSRSTAGALMYKVADHFLVQNEELLQLYPKAVFCGRL